MRRWEESEMLERAEKNGRESKRGWPKWIDLDLKNLSSDGVGWERLE